MPTVRIVGPGRAGSSLAGALAACGWTVADAVRRGDDPTDAAAGVDLCVIATPDAAIAATSDLITPVPTTVVAHLSGALGAETIRTHARRAALHPLASLPDPGTGQATLLAGVWWAVEGDALAYRVVADLGGEVIPMTADPLARARYHAAAAVAANHIVALMAQVERIAASAGLPVEPFYGLAERALANARAHGAGAAITGPAARGDRATIERHLAAIEPAEQELYTTLSQAAGDMACR